MLIDDRSKMFVSLFATIAMSSMLHAQDLTQKDFSVFAGRKPYVHKKSKMLHMIPQPVTPSVKELEWESARLKAQRKIDEEQTEFVAESFATFACPDFEDEFVHTRRGLAIFGLHIADDKDELLCVQDVLIKRLAKLGIDSKRFEKFKNFHSSILYTRTDDPDLIERYKQNVSRAIGLFMHQHQESPVYQPVVLVNGPVSLFGNLRPGEKLFFGVDVTPGDYVKDLFHHLSSVHPIRDAHHVSIGCLKVSDWHEVNMLAQEFDGMRGPVCVPFECGVDTLTLFPTASCDRQDYLFALPDNEELMVEVEDE